MLTDTFAAGDPFPPPEAPPLYCPCGQPLCYYPDNGHGLWSADLDDLIAYDLLQPTAHHVYDASAHLCWVGRCTGKPRRPPAQALGHKNTRAGGPVTPGDEQGTPASLSLVQPQTESAQTGTFCNFVLAV